MGLVGSGGVGIGKERCTLEKSMLTRTLRLLQVAQPLDLPGTPTMIKGLHCLIFKEI